MTNKPKFIALATILAVGALCAFPASARYITKSQIKAVTPEGRMITVTAVNDNVLRITNVPEGSHATPAQSVEMVGIANGVTITDHLTDEGTISLTTASGLTAVIDDRAGGVLTINPSQPRRMVVDYATRETSQRGQEIKLYTTSPGSYYGAGERGHKLNLRGDTLTMYNRQNYGYTKGDPRINQMNITMPLFLSSDGFAIVFDDFAYAEMILGNPIEYITESNLPVTYYYVNGPSTLASLSEELSNVIGRQELPPLWSLGYITSKYGYHTQDETVGVIDTLKRKGYPVDGIVLDLYWYGKEEDMGRLAWDPEQWPNPTKMMSDLKRKGVNVVTISQPYILRNGRGVDNYNTLKEQSLMLMDSTGKAPQEVTIWVGEGGMFDVSNPATRQWLSDRYKQLTDMGVGGWWGDLGEPEVHPQTGLHNNGLAARQYHNKYGNDWSKIIYDLFKQQYPDRRLLTMMRGGTIGLQKYSVFPWSTDVSRSWGGMQPQVTIMLNSGLSGLGYMGHDVGGFAIDPENPVDPELYVRWLQLGLFSPMLRTHAQQVAEPYKYPELASIIEPLIKERYRWLPYNYTLAYDNATKGLPMVRPLNYYIPNSNAYDDIDDEYLWGSEVLVAPVLQQGATSRPVTFPASGKWVDMKYPYTVYDGGTTVADYPAPLDVLPLFAKAGAFIPLADYKMGSTLDYKPGTYTVDFYPVEGVSSEYTLYEDNTDSTVSLKKNQFRLTTFKGSFNDGRITVDIHSEGDFPGAPKVYNYTFVLKGIDKAPTSTGANERRVSFDYNAKAHTLTVKLRYNPGFDTQFAIDF